jgi:hypothetical protein
LLTGNKNIPGYSQDLNLGRKFGYTNAGAIAFVGAGCANGDAPTTRRVVFDYLGRPIQADVRTATAIYQNGQFLTGECTIQLTNDAGERYDITIQPETGFANATRT